MYFKFYSHDTTGNIVRAGVENAQFREILAFLANEIHSLGQTEETITDLNDVRAMCVELSSLLKELNCPYISLTHGNIDGYKKGSLQLLEYLISELMSLKMYHTNQLNVSNRNGIRLDETQTAMALQAMANVLNVKVASGEIMATDLFQQFNLRIDDIFRKTGKVRIGKPLFNSVNSIANEWEALEKRHAELETEYHLRKKMLVTRLDCTIQAFSWSDRMKPKKGDILDVYQKKLSGLEKLLNGGESTDIVAMLAARDLLLAIEKASSAAVLKNTKSKIQRHIIGKVPDRGKYRMRFLNKNEP